MFRSVPLSVIRSFSLYTQQWYVSYRFADNLRAASGWKWFGLLQQDQDGNSLVLLQHNQTGSVLILLASCQQLTYLLAYILTY